MKKILIAVFAMLITSAYGQNCEMIAKYGVYDTHTLNVSRERALSYLNLFKRDVIMTYDEAKSFSSSIGIPIEGVLVQMGMTASAESYRKFVESVQAMTAYDEYFVEKVQAVSQTVNMDIVKVLQACYEQNGIHVHLENSEDEDVYYVVVYFKWNGNHGLAQVVLTWDAEVNAVTINGQVCHNKKLEFTLDNGEEKRFSVKRSVSTQTIPFTVNVKRSGTGGTVQVRPGRMTLYKKKVLPVGTGPILKFAQVGGGKLGRTPQAGHTGDGDDEFRRFETTHLFGTFSIGPENDNKNIVGVLNAHIKEENSDWTEFILGRRYTLYTAPEGYHIIGFEFTDGSGFHCGLDARQSEWVKTEKGSGPLDSYEWQGDSGNDHDQIEGAWVDPIIKPFTVVMEKI